MMADYCLNVAEIRAWRSKQTHLHAQARVAEYGKARLFTIESFKRRFHCARNHILNGNDGKLRISVER